MDYLGDLMFIIFFVIFAVGSYVTSKKQKSVKIPEFPDSKKDILDSDTPEYGFPGEDVLPENPTPKRKNKRKIKAQNTNMQDPVIGIPESEVNQRRENSFEKFPDADNEDNDIVLDNDELKKAVVYSEILNRKY